MLVAKNTEEAREIGKKLSREEVLAYWEEYTRSLSNLRLAEEMLKKSFREQMLRETVEGYLGATDHHSLTRDHIEMLLKKRRGHDPHLHAPGRCPGLHRGESGGEPGADKITLRD